MILISRDLLKQSMEVTLEDIKYVMKTYLSKFFDPKESCCALMVTDPTEKATLSARLQEMGYNLETVELTELCTHL
jgi:Zn-dependent M16 (insulinase) family peptidase